MPVYTQLIRKETGEPESLRWGGWHRFVLYEMAKEEDPTIESEDDRRFFCGFPNEPNGWEYSKYHRAVDPDDGEVLEIFPGDIYTAGR